MRRCDWCKKRAVPNGESQCRDCKFVFEIGTAATVIIISGAIFIALFGR